MRIIIVSPPKSGNVWLKCLLSNIYGLRVVTPAPKSVQELIESFHNKDFGDDFVFHQHFYPSLDLMKAAESESCQFVTILRDPYDTFVSLYFFAQNFHKQFKSHPKLSMIINKPIEHPDVLEFLRREEMGFGSNLRLAEAWVKSNISIIIRYEQLKLDTFSSLKNLTSQIDPVVDNILYQAITSCSINKMRKDKQRYSKHIRRGTIGDWQNHLTQDHIRIFKEQYSQIIKILGYHVV